MSHPSLSRALKKQAQKKSRGKSKHESAESEKDRAASAKHMEELQRQVLLIQQAIRHRRSRAIIVFEGFDASGKGGCIRAVTELLDPRGIAVHAVGPPTAIEQGTHWLYRFWRDLPPPGTLAVFDRSWYGRVLVERVEGLIPKPAWKRAYREIREFERMLTEDGVDVIKFFLAVSPEEQLHRFEQRLKDPVKRWKLTLDDLKARRHGKRYIEAADDLLSETHVPAAPWNVIPSDDKEVAHLRVLEELNDRFAHHREWLQARGKEKLSEREIRKELRRAEKG